ncbi:MEP1B [Bugula neritina]|uniref:Metalloendopeptidase n=1 Tax=Bugula neritina TaxID=10212 RepID=A0A7J7J6A8_BUGNE|nr:MEP1B [Bugula neritina]
MQAIHNYISASEELRVFEEVKAAYEKYTCISLIPRTNQRDYINIKRGGGCWSYVGRISGAQDMSLDTGCLYLKKTAIHEFMHALGFWHEQSRPDRDNYIDIHLENVNSGLHHNFEPQKAENVDLFGTVYDYRSVMHYSRTAFSNNRRDTITTKNPKFLDIIGRGPTFSFLDLYILHKLYTCDSECNTADRCPAGSYRGKDCQCYCSNDDINNNEPAVLCDSVTTPKPTTPMPTTSTQTTPRSTTSKPTTTFKPTTTSKPTTTPNPTISPDKECKEPNENCNCKVTGWGGYSKECRKVSKSICDTDSGKCVCKLGYKYSKRPGRRAKCVKVRIPRCSRPDEYCGCEEKGPRACARIPNSFCNTVNGTCECMNTYTSGNGWKCEKEVGGEMFQTAGDRIPPFLNQRTPINWHPDRGAEPNLQFGLQKNGYRLRAAGQGSRVWAALETPPLSERNGGQFWCISLNYNLNYGALFVEFSSADRRWKPYKVFYSEGDSPVWYPLTLKIETTGAETNMRLGARSYPWSYSGVWSVNLDPLKVYAC